jgi:hypothetical protein
VSAPQFTPAPLKVVLDGTLTGVWAEVRQECTDPDTKEVWERELGRTDTAYVRCQSEYAEGHAPWDTIENAPEQYEATEDRDEIIANAHLWAAAPELYEALLDIRNRILCPVGPTPTLDELEEIASAAVAKVRGEQ